MHTSGRANMFLMLPGEAIFAISSKWAPEVQKISLGDTLGKPLSSMVASQASTDLCTDFSTASFII
jgi:hypothetical protein